VPCDQPNDEARSLLPKAAGVNPQSLATNLTAIRETFQPGGFYIERMSLLYDHIHALLKITPSLCIRDCVEDLMNKTWRFMMDRYEGVLKNTGAYNVWTQSFYVSTVGHSTTAQVKSFLSN